MDKHRWKAWRIGATALLLAGLCHSGIAQTASGSKQRPSHAGAQQKKVVKPVAVRPKATVAQRKEAPRVNRQFVAKAPPKAGASQKTSVVRAVAPARLSMAERLGLRDAFDPLDLDSSVALVVDQETREVLFSKNDHAVLPIASLTKLMTGLVVADAGLDMDQMITITQADVDTYKGSRSRLAVGTRLSRGELMHLSLMSSENRAAHALGRTFPGGMSTFVTLMNARATQLGMMETRFVEPTGLMSANRSSARDLAKLALAAYEQPMLRELSTSPGHQVELGRHVLQYNNSNRLIRNPDWDIGLQKTGYISEAGRCLVMQASVAGRQLVMVFLDARNTNARASDAERVRRWLEQQFSENLGMPEAPRM